MGKNKTCQILPEKKEKLFSVTLDDCDIDTFSAGGPGGQHQNTSNTAIRITHRESGATGESGESREYRSQLQNKKAAFKRMVESKRFKIWINKMIWAAGKSPEQKVREDMQPQNLRIEAFDGEEWHYIG